MALQATFRPISNWPASRTKNRQPPRFKSTYTATLQLLERELGHLHASQVVIQAGFHLQDIRQDGWPRSNARKPSDPGVIVSFGTASGPMAFPCDRYTDWESNLRAIALSLEALRAVDRYGVTRHKEQYRGWTQIAAPAAAATFSDRQAAAIWLASHAVVPKDYILADFEAAERAYKTAAKKLHPDAGGSAAEFQTLQDAMKVIRAGDSDGR